ncbi:uncharacterized protein ACLA_087020 [Aspergillus clavatus NRRL 1]|uniref:Integral membrane protein n=1 Tax=Aspergillus clavatus (strain ATCC 1007 / CBS 513.65 / DSM 816 / NCTC 3887 / NRRL 1 / QM 1276 / 107) TaxID=344612 RepID=A1CUL2_ASPCL|nr:uncharacterized protein ACLA_087020 [Aspergillus clavatus NRRL 1]EAW06999.1 conserved hypothetical protein [Aspergillus clavatus NRRL 1]
MSTKLHIASISWLLASLGHTLAAKDWQSLPEFRKLPGLAYTCAKAGWYQGSAFLLVAALLNYHWAQNPEALSLPANQGVAALLAGIMGVSSGWYLKNGVRRTGIVVAVMGAVQAWAVWV